MEDDKGAGLLLILFIVAIIWFWKPVNDRWGGRMTGYIAVVCSPKCPGPEGSLVAAETAVFAVFPAQQSVLFKYDDEPPHRLNDCVVMDLGTWSCDLYQANDSQLKAAGEWTKFLPRWRWYLLKYLDFQP